MRNTLIAALFLAIPLTPALAAEQLDGKATYDLLFREHTLDDVEPGQTLTYTRAVSNTLNPAAAERDSGQIEMSFDKERALMAVLELKREDDKHRGLGRFPASVGNPMIMFFYESVVRDMAESAGGSPFYIRNRVKDSLVKSSEVIAGEAEVDGKVIPTQSVTLRPFENDPNADRMKGFDELELEVVMSDEVPGWYVSLTASVPGEGKAPTYLSEIDFRALEAAQ
ncbi:hypothetical protein [Sagittula salina]|uniref:Uncharacterized protein n=1 Tax=Sagittula salina TaxID=2820268 RepID=A0A940S1Z7_9RHOB|nr:hypothetical protein [Sagittula salina]MBP0484698.1 hypothetical protein [Sagittula salina]